MTTIETGRKHNPETEFFKPESIAVVLTTFYPQWYKGELKSISDTDKVRGDLALQTIAGGTEKGYSIVVGDAESSPEFITELGRIPDITFFKREEVARGVGRRQGYLKAKQIDGIKGILRVEAEKVSVVSKLTSRIMGPILRGEADIVVPMRNDDIWRLTHPAYMRASEIRANKKYNDILHIVGLLSQDVSLEWFFGPVAFANKPEILDLFLEKYEFTSFSKYEAGISLSPEDWSNSMLFPVVKALYLGLKVISVEIPFEYPSTQRQNEETAVAGSLDKFIAKRNHQRQKILTELIHFIRLLQANPKSRLVKIK